MPFRAVKTSETDFAHRSHLVCHSAHKINCNSKNIRLNVKMCSMVVELFIFGFTLFTFAAFQMLRKLNINTTKFLWPNNVSLSMPPSRKHFKIMSLCHRRSSSLLPTMTPFGPLSLPICNSWRKFSAWCICNLRLLAVMPFPIDSNWHIYWQFRSRPKYAHKTLCCFSSNFRQASWRGQVEHIVFVFINSHNVRGASAADLCATWMSSLNFALWCWRRDRSFQWGRHGWTMRYSISEIIMHKDFRRLRSTTLRRFAIALYARVLQPIKTIKLSTA